MITKSEYVSAVRKTMTFFERTGIIVTDEEKARIQVADFGLGRLDEVGLEMLTYVSTDRMCAKELVLFPFQACPQHMHPNIGVSLGKEETYRVRKGTVYFYVEGEGKREDIKIKCPNTSVSVFKEIKLTEGMQYTLAPNSWHWFAAGSRGAVISEFSTRATDKEDIFFDKEVKSISEVV